MEITLDCFKVRALLRDPAFYAALLPIAASIHPPIGAWVLEHKEAFYPMGVVLGGHFAVRTAGALSAGRVGAAVAKEQVRTDQIFGTAPAGGGDAR